MKVAIIGYAFSGKTTLFHAISGGHFRGDVSAVRVPDSRFEALCNDVQPKKRTHATLEFWDNAVRVPEVGGVKSSEFAEEARRFDAFVHVVREFDDPSVPFHAPPDPERDVNAIETEMIIADLQMVENRLERLAKEGGETEYAHRELLEKAKKRLEEGTPVRAFIRRDESFDSLVEEFLSHYQFLTVKPLVIAINCHESALRRSDAIRENDLRGSPPKVRLCAKLEKEIMEMEPEERKSFLETYGLTELGSEVLVRKTYDSLGLITFYTTVGNEAKAWPLKKGSNALKAAATIHTEIAKGFIRAEVIHFKDFERLGSLKRCHEEHAMKVEGKEYIVQDGDILNIRHKM